MTVGRRDPSYPECADRHRFERGWVWGHGPLYQSVSKSLTIEKRGDRKDTEFPSLASSVKEVWTCKYIKTVGR